MLRGNKATAGNKEGKKTHLDDDDDEEEAKDTYADELEDKGKDPWDINEDNGEFSNIDEIFERKLKEKQLQFKEDEDEEGEFGLMKKARTEPLISDLSVKLLHVFSCE